MLRHAAIRVQSHITLDFLLPRLAPQNRTIATSFRTASEVIPAKISRQLTSPEVVHALSNISSLPSGVHSLSESDAESFNKLISSLRRALMDSKVDAAYKHWDELSQKGFLRLLGPAHLDMCSRYLGGVCSRILVQDIKFKFSDDQLKHIEEIALYAAIGGYPNALKEYLVFRLKQNEPETVHRVYDEYFSGVVAQTELPSQPHQEFADDAEISELPNPEDGHIQPASDSNHEHHDVMNLPFVNLDIACAKIAACAMQGRFRDALSAILKTKVRLLSYHVNLFVARFRGRPEVRRAMAQYIPQLELGRLLSRPKSLQTQLANLTGGNADSSLERLYKQLRSALLEEDRWVSVDQPLDDKILVVVPHFVWGCFLSAFLKCRRLDLAEQLWDDLTLFKVKPDLHIWNSLLEGYADSSPTIAQRVSPAWKAMSAQNIKPNTLSYRALIQGLFHSRAPEDAMRRFDEFQTFVAVSRGLEDADILRVFNTTLHGLLINNMEADAMRVLQQMQDEGPLPDIISFNTIMRQHERKGDTKAIANLLRQIDSLGLKGDVFTFSMLLRALLRVRNDAIEIVFNLMEKQGVKPNTALYTGIIDFLLKQPDASVLKTALALLTRMEQSGDEDITPNEITYTNFIARILQATWLEDAAVEELRKDLTQRMKDRGIAPTRPMYNILLKASLSNPGYEGVQYALGYYREMIDRKVGLGHDAWWVILQGLAKRKEWGLATQMTVEMESIGFTPSGSLLHLVNRIKDTWAQENSTRRH